MFCFYWSCRYESIPHNPSQSKVDEHSNIKPFCSFLYSSRGFHVSFLHIWTHWHITGRDRKMFFVSLLWPKERSVYEKKTQTVAGTQRCSAAVFTSLASKSKMTSNTATPLAVSIWTWGAQPECRTGTFCHSKHIRKRDSTTKQQSYNLQTRVSKPSHDC